MPRAIAFTLVAIGVVLGTIDDRSVDVPVFRAGSYQIIAGDFHVHGFPGDGSLPPRELRREAARRGLGVIALSNHNQMAMAKLARDHGDALPILLPAQEVTAPSFHIVAAGIRDVIDWDQSAAAVIADAHAQGGVAIAAHPTEYFWPGYDDAALRTVDGTEIAHSRVDSVTAEGRDMRRFHQRARALSPRVAAIGSSDFHTSAPLGQSRTYLLLTEVTRAGVLDALRSGRTVARNGHGELLGDSANIALVRQALGSSNAPDDARGSFVQRLAVIFVLAGLFLLTILGPLRPGRHSDR